MINVYLKLSDVAGRSHQDLPYTDVHPFIENLLSVFGAERTVWGTGYPGHHRQKHNWPHFSAGTPSSFEKVFRS